MSALLGAGCIAATEGSMANAIQKTAKGHGAISKAPTKFPLQFQQSELCPIDALKLDLNNPRLQTGEDVSASNEEELIATLLDIAALDELVLSICTNKYLNLEPLIVWGPANGPYTVLEGNRRLASIRLIRDPGLAKRLGVKLPAKLHPGLMASLSQLLVYRVHKPEDAREFIGFKHINGPQRWDAYAKARYVTDWYKEADGTITIDEIADRMGDNNNTLRAYIYAVLMLDQAEESGKWKIEDRPPTRGRFGFSHLYTALGRIEYQEFLGLTSGWSNKPPLKPIKRAYLDNLGETLTYIYGSRSEGRPSLIKSQNPDLKNLGIALSNPTARVALQQRATLDEALELFKEPAAAFHDALIAAKLRLDRAISLMSGYSGGDESIDSLVSEIYEQADVLNTMNEKKRARLKK